MVSLRKLPLIKSETIKKQDPDEGISYCTKCGCNDTLYSCTEYYSASRKWPASWYDMVTLCERCARVEGWEW